MTPAQLSRQLQWLVERGYRGAMFDDALTSSPSPGTLAVTLDAADSPVLELAHPDRDRRRSVGED